MTKKRILIPLILIPFIAGCIVSGNILVVVKLGDKHLTTGQSYDSWYIVKEDYPDWEEHADDINHVVDIGFSVTVDNTLGSVPATGEFYISKFGDLSKADLDPDSGKAYLVLSGITVPAGDKKHITWQGSYRYLRNIDRLKKFIMSGEFYLYVVGVTTPLDVWLEKMAAILTINGNP